MTLAVVSGFSRTVTTGATVLAAAALAIAADDRAIVAERVGRLTRDTQWQLVQSLPIEFRTFHPQGMVKIRETFFVSSVEVRTPTRRLSPSQQGRDRDAGEGSGHLFQIDKMGKLVSDLTLGEGSIYHPGGIDSTARASGCRSPSTGPTADRSSIASTRRR